MNRYEEVKKENYDIGANIIKSFLSYEEKKSKNKINYTEKLKENYEKQNINKANVLANIEMKKEKWYQKIFDFIKRLKK